jgi:hypothetical protein
VPLVLAQNEKSAADIVYADDLGVSYEFPAVYRSLIKEGERFVYYRGKRKEDDSIQVPHYFGAGVIGKTTPGEDGLYRCAILHYQPFEPVVPFKIDGKYLEPDANKRPSRHVGLYYQKGVRLIDRETYDAICNLGIEAAREKRHQPKLKKLEPAKKAGPSSSSELEKFALQLALAECRSRWPGAKSFVALAGGPFSIAVHVAKDDPRYIAVKATAEPQPYLRLTAEEVKYSKRNAERYSVWVFYETDPGTGTARLLSHDGAITNETVELEAALHGGRLRTGKTGKEVGPIPD